VEEKLKRRLAAASWERAGTWVQQGLVRPVRRSPEEEVWVVQQPGAPARFEVLVWPREKDWACSCEQEACVHAAAALQARGLALPPPPTTTEVRTRYTLTRQEGQLLLDRVVPPAAVRTPEDQELNRLMAGWWGKSIPRNLAPLVLPLLANRPLELRGPVLQGTRDQQGPVTVDPKPLMPLIRVEDDKSGFKVRMVRAPGIDEVFSCGILRQGTVLRMIGQADFEESFKSRLMNGISFAETETYRLVAETLPELRKRLKVEVVTARLPELVVVPPRLDFEVENEGGRLAITARLVYGDPPIARLERDSLRSLGKNLAERNMGEERRLKEQLERYAPGLALNLRVEREGERALALIDSLSGPIKEEISRKLPGFRKVREEVTPSLRLSDDGRGGWKVEVEAGGVSEDTLLKAWQDRSAYMPVAGGGWRPVPKAWLEQHIHVLQELLSARDSKGSIPQSAGLMLLSSLESLQQQPPVELGRLRALAGDFEAIPATPLPEGVEATLRPYQQRGVDWLVWLRSIKMGGLLADDMGLGKTLQTLVGLAAAGGRNLVVAPTSVLRNWEIEARRFLPGKRICVYHGPKRELDPRAWLTVTSYALLRLDQELLQKVSWTTLVLDEAQAIKNPDAQVAQAAYALAAEQRLALTGTPVENRLEELWSAFHFINPGLLGSRSSFRQRFEDPIQFGNRAAQQALRKRIRPFLLRRMKKDVAKELPERTELVLRCTLSDDERNFYESVKNIGKADIQKLLEGGRMLHVLELLLRMRQAACSAALVSKSWDKGSSKLELLLETLDEVLAEGHAALVFSQWTSLLDQVEPLLKERGIRYCRLDGSTRDRAAVVAQFSAEDGPPVFLLSLKAGGTGLNLTRADYVFHLDPWWNPAAEDQATDRAHRIGQLRPVFSCKLIAEDTVEERILELQSRKRDLVKAALDDDALARALTREELLALFD
jgi:superfamily II DNA or RNA helicase